ncbi:claudin-4-like [Gadus chalcogrammus]|uniref:claudin-4-like n=1 Tax=Gadus chalcogrammus TaxID=1042646 RepID=UPI0024C481C6|nr:claudin-4-like [Gadus chalcogrammus]
MNAKLEVLALVLGFLGLVGTVAVTAMPMWRVTAFIGANIVVMEMTWEGLWMNCVWQAGVRTQCKVYDSLLILTPDLQAARALTLVSVGVAAAALLVAFCGGRRTACCRGNPKGKDVTLVVGGSLFLLACVTTLLPVCWTAHAVITDFYNPVVSEARKRELGAALYVGWGTAGLLLAAGAILIFRYSARREKERGTPTYGAEGYHVTGTEGEEERKEDVADVARSAQAGSLYGKQQYV